MIHELPAGPMNVNPKARRWYFACGKRGCEICGPLRNDRHAASRDAIRHAVLVHDRAKRTALVGE
jgi:hypothetical protein